MEFVSTGHLSKNSRIAICLFGNITDFSKLAKGLKLLTYNIPDISIDYFANTYQQLDQSFIDSLNIKNYQTQPNLETYGPSLEDAFSLARVSILKQRFEADCKFKYDAVIAVNTSSEIRYTVLSTNQEITDQTVYGFGYYMDTSVMQFRLDNLVWFSDSNTFDTLSRIYFDFAKNPLLSLKEEVAWHSYIKKHNINITPLEYKAVILDAKKRPLI